MKTLIFPIAAAALMGACAPYPPYPAPHAPPTSSVPSADQPPAITDAQQLELDRQRKEEQLRRKREQEQNRSNTVDRPADTKPKYPTAASVPGKPGFVFNPYTHNIVNVKGIASGKLVRDPEDNDDTHKFRVP